MYCFVLRMGGGLGAYSAHGQAKQRLRAKRISQLEYGPPGLGNQVFGQRLGKLPTAPIGYGQVIQNQQIMSKPFSIALAQGTKMICLPEHYSKD